jgi:lipopolysaccharide export system permease protein
VFGNTLQRMIMVELMKVFSITLIGLTIMFLMGGIVAEASNRGLAPAQILTIIPLMIPSTLPYTIPTTTLFATCNVYGRMAKDNEVTALRAAGVNLWTILKPSILLGVAGTAVTMGLFWEVIPGSFQQMRNRLAGDVNELLITLLKRQGCFKHAKTPYVLFAREVHGDRLVDVIFKHKLPNGLYDVVARAKEGKLHIEVRTDPATNSTYRVVVVEMFQCWVIDNTKPGNSFVHDYEFTERLPAEIFGDNDSPRSSDVPWPELFRRAERYRLRELERAATIDAMSRDIKSRPNPAPVERARLEGSLVMQRSGLREYRAFESEKHLRVALALSCMCFVLLGAPIGIWANRADLLSSFVIGFLPVVLIYYPVLICMTNLTKDGRIPIPIAMWTANALFSAVAVGMCWRLIRR